MGACNALPGSPSQFAVPLWQYYRAFAPPKAVLRLRLISPRLISPCPPGLQAWGDSPVADARGDGLLCYVGTSRFIFVSTLILLAVDRILAMQ